MRVLVSGGTGFIGGYLVRGLCARGDTVTILTRGGARDDASDTLRYASWDPVGGDAREVVSGQDAVVHLAGEPAVGARWTEGKKRQIVASRVESTKRLVEGMARAAPRPATFVCASGIGYYGPRAGSEPLDETSSGGSDFLAQVTQAWEGAAEEATALGVRVVRARFGIVFGRGGGALAEMVKPFKLFVGGPIGSGEQVVSWVHVDDLVGAILRCLDDEGIRGPVNVTAPNPVTNAELARAIGEALGRPSGVRVPAAALRLRFGEGADPLLTGQRALPGVLTSRGFSFAYTDVREAVRASI